VAAEALECGATEVLTGDPDDVAALLADRPEVIVRRV
jgi:hypothetical protein